MSVCVYIITRLLKKKKINKRLTYGGENEFNHHCKSEDKNITTKNSHGTESNTKYKNFGVSEFWLRNSKLIVSLFCFFHLSLLFLKTYQSWS